MREILDELDGWLFEGLPVSLATVISTWGSGPRGPGSKMVSAMARGTRRIAGSVSGGCVEASVVEAGESVIQSGIPQLLRFGVADETAWSVGLSCGGTIEVFVEPVDEAAFANLKRELAAERPAVRAVVVAGPEGELGRDALLCGDGQFDNSFGEAVASELRSEMEAALAEGRPRRVGLAGDRDVFIDVLLPPPSLVIVGGVHIAIALTSIARTLGYRTTIVDPRGVFGSVERFAHADALIQEWPDQALSTLRLNRSTAVATLTHDPKLDDPALTVALRSEAFYVGALGSRKTHAKRLARLREAGLADEELARLWAPIGLGIGSRTPPEIALSVMAQIVAAGNGVLEPSR